ncbi:MAG: mechanosensitive ion channel family protein [Ottowia sp.]|nr:mechanosensitive ion channel family protein [Ottowia sp.]
MRFNRLINAFAGLDSYHQQWIYAALALLATLALTLVVHFVVRRRSGRHVAGQSAWRSAVLGALSAPLQVLVWLIGLSVAVELVTAEGHLPALARIFAPARDMAVIATVAWFLIRVMGRMSDGWRQVAGTEGARFDQTTAGAIYKVSFMVIALVALMIGAQTLGFSIASLLAFGGVAGIAVGFAAQGLVANLLGGATVYASRPFSVGEDIIFPGTDLMGTVQEIGWRATRIRGWNGKPFYVPNAKFNTETIINHSRQDYRSVEEFIHVPLQYLDTVPGIVDDVNRMLAQHPEMDHANAYHVFNLDSYGDYALRFILFAWIKSTTYLGYEQAKQDMLLKIAGIIRRHGAELALPTSRTLVSGGLKWPDEPPAPA